MVYKGSGGRLPSTVRAEGKSPDGSPFGFGLYEDLPSGKRKKVSLFKVSPGEKNVPFVFLDEAPPSDEEAPSVRIHRDFKYRGSFGNSVICISYRDGGCPMDKALEGLHRCFPNCEDPCKRKGKNVPMKGGWRWIASVIKMKPFTFTRGKFKGKVVPYQRCLLMVPEKQFPTFMAYREQFEEMGGLRGRVFHVRREDNQRSSKIGTTFTPVGEMTDEEMIAKFEEAASDYGLPVEQYIQPLDYEKVLVELSDDEMAEAAQYVSRERGVKLDESPEDESNESEASEASADTSVDTGTEDDSEEMPF